MPPLILVTGATGYIASRLIPQLLERNYRIRALARQPHRLKNRSWFPQVEMVQGDVMDSSTLVSALAGVHTAYYLIHNMASGHGYAERELDAARNFTRAAQEAGVQHIIYLGGLADEEQYVSPHLRSRIETGVVLRQGRVPVTEFRAGVVAGSGSISFEMIRFMTEQFPILPAPVWLKNKSQPIAVQNVVDYLLAALDNWNGHGQVLEIGGPDITTYQDLMLCYARIRGYKRRIILLPYIPIWFMAYGIGLVTPVPRSIAYALVGGLSSDSVVMHNDARRIYPEVNLVDFESVVREAMTRLHPLKISDFESQTSKHEGFFIDHRKIKIDAEPGKVFHIIKNLRMRRFIVDAIEPDRLLLLRSQRKTPGEGWVEWRISRDGAPTNLTQTIYFAPHGFGGFLYWHLLHPFYALVFRGLIKGIARNSVVK